MNIKKTFSLILLLVLTVTAWAANLNDSAIMIKRGAPDVFEVIKDSATDEWGADHSMVLYEINRQADAFVAVSELMESGNLELQKIIITAMAEWTRGGRAMLETALSSPDRFALFKLDTDWTMVEFETLLQLEALGALQ